MESPTLTPPVGFRKAIPVLVKLKSVLRAGDRCASCGQKLGDIEGLQFDHVPALGLRAWNETERDTVPPANDPEHLIPRHIKCHEQKTTGRKGESKLSKVGGDISEIAKLRRLTRKQEDFRRTMLGKGNAEDAPEQDRRPPFKRAWPKRKFPTKKG
jgi:hypothetical protein